MKVAQVGYFLGLILAIVAGSMVVPAVYAWATAIPGGEVFFVSAAITGFSHSARRRGIRWMPST